MKRNNVSKYRGRNILEEQEINKEINKLIKQTDNINKMLKALKNNNMYDDSGAVENLITYAGSKQVNAITNKGYISKKAIKGSRSLTKLTAIEKSINDFIRNKQSTVEGMKDLYDSHTAELLKITDNEEWVNSLSIRQVKNIYKMFKTEEYEKINSTLGSDDIFTPYVNAISEQWTESKFIDTILKNTGNMNDLDLRDDLRELYRSSIKGKIQYAKSKE